MILLILWYSDFTWHCLSIKIVTIGCCWKWTCFFPTEAPAQKQVYKSTEDFLQLKELSGQISTNGKWIPAKLYLAFIVIYCHLPRSIICSKNGLDFLWMVPTLHRTHDPNRWADIGEKPQIIDVTATAATSAAAEVSAKVASQRVVEFWEVEFLGGSCHLVRCYCWWKKSCTTWDVWNLVNNGIFIISTGAGFIPSTVVKGLQAMYK